MTRAAARIYVARVLGGANDDKAWDLAEEALVRAASDWQTAHRWEAYLKDTSDGFVVTSCVFTGLSPTFAAPSAGSLDGVNIGQAVAGTGVTAGTLVSSYTRAADGSVATVTLSTTPAAGTVSLTFTGDIPIIAGVRDYNAPTDMASPHMAELSSRPSWPIEFIRPRYWNKLTGGSTTPGTVDAYTLFNSVSPTTQQKGNLRLRVYRIPAQADVMRSTYYRAINATADPLDIPDDYLYTFHDYARGLLVLTKRAMDDPAGYLQIAGNSLQDAKTDDAENAEDEEVRLISQMEVGNMDRPLWNNGQFDLFYGQ